MVWHKCDLTLHGDFKVAAGDTSGVTTNQENFVIIVEESFFCNVYFACADVITIRKDFILQEKFSF